jgi:hypothetical protein
MVSVSVALQIVEASGIWLAPAPKMLGNLMTA